MSAAIHFRGKQGCAKEKPRVRKTWSQQAWMNQSKLNWHYWTVHSTTATFQSTHDSVQTRAQILKTVRPARDSNRVLQRHVSKKMFCTLCKQHITKKFTMHEMSCYLKKFEKKLKKKKKVTNYTLNAFSKKHLHPLCQRGPKRKFPSVYRANKSTLWRIFNHEHWMGSG